MRYFEKFALLCGGLAIKVSKNWSLAFEKSETPKGNGVSAIDWKEQTSVLVPVSSLVP